MAMVSPAQRKVGDLKKLDSKDAKTDIQIAAGMTTAALLSQQGLQAIQSMLKGAQDPVEALAHVIFMAMGKVRHMLAKKNIKIDDKIWIAGGGALDRILFEVMMVLATALKFQQAQDPKFVASVKGAVLDLMHDSDQSQESLKVLHDKGLPVPQQQQAGQAPPSGGQPQQGLVAPQAANQQAGGQQ